MTALVAAVLLVITDWRKASVPLTEGLERNPYGGGSRTERLIAETENKEKTYELVDGISCNMPKFLL